MSKLSDELGFLARQDLSLILDNESPLGNDWRGLLDRMGFSYTMVMILQKKSSPTQSLLEEWERSLGELVNYMLGKAPSSPFVASISCYHLMFLSHVTVIKNGLEEI